MPFTIGSFTFQSFGTLCDTYELINKLKNVADNQDENISDVSRNLCILSFHSEAVQEQLRVLDEIFPKLKNSNLSDNDKSLIATGGFIVLEEIENVYRYDNSKGLLGTLKSGIIFQSDQTPNKPIHKFEFARPRAIEAFEVFKNHPDNYSAVIQQKQLQSLFGDELADIMINTSIWKRPGALLSYAWNESQKDASSSVNKPSSPFTKTP